MLRISLTGFLITVIAFLTVACIGYIPIPEYEKLQGRGEKLSDLDAFRNSKGNLTREDILMMLGDPNLRIYHDEVFCYRRERVAGIFFVIIPYADADADLVFKNDWACIKFDNTDKLIKFDLVQPHVFQDDENMRDDLLEEWGLPFRVGAQSGAENIKLEVIKSLAEQGIPESQWRLYDEYERKTENLIWLCRSADNGYAKAQLQVGDIYWSNSSRIKINHNQINAYVWYKLASTGSRLQGLHPDKKTQNEASMILQEVIKLFSQDQIDEAEKRYATWTHGQCERELLPELNKQ